jgi:carbamate kinase
VSHGHVIIVGDGGGIPVVDDENLHGIEAVIDKDLTAGLLARDLDAGSFMILINVPHVSISFGTPSENPIRNIKAEDVTRLLSAGEFP